MVWFPFTTCHLIYNIKAEKAAEREAAKEQGATLKGESEQMRESSAKLAGDNTPEEHANTR